MGEFNMEDAPDKIREAFEAAKAGMQQRPDAGQATTWAVLTSIPYVNMTTIVMPMNGMLNVLVPNTGAGAFVLRVDGTTTPLTTGEWYSVPVSVGDGLTVLPSPPASSNVGQIQYYLV